MSLLLEGKVAVITGAASKRGIGKATAQRFAEHGARVALLDLDAAQSEAAAADVGSSHRGYGCDVADAAQCQAVTQRILADFGQIDILVNYAGVSQPDKLMEVTPANYDLVMNVNLRAPSTCARRWCRISARASRAISSPSAPSPPSAAAGSSAARIIPPPRGGAEPRQIHGPRARPRRHPGQCHLAWDDRYRHLPGQDDREHAQRHHRQHPAGPLGSADDVAKACLFLVSDLASYITGTVLDVNGAG
jgi:Dehydrogenases with different specificities (related to short-chain alcohol dehydrogenases)